MTNKMENFSGKNEKAPNNQCFLAYYFSKLSEIFTKSQTQGVLKIPSGQLWSKTVITFRLNREQAIKKVLIKCGKSSDALKNY